MAGFRNAQPDPVRDYGRGNPLIDLLWRHRSRWGKFGLIVLIIVGLSMIASLVTQMTILKPTRAAYLYIAVLAPVSGPEKAFGQSVVNGTEIAVELLNDAGGIHGASVGTVVFDTEGGAAAAAEAIAERDDIAAVIVGLDDEVARGVLPALSSADLPVIMTKGALPRDGAAAPVFSLGYAHDREVAFLANYVRNVLGEVLVSTVTYGPRHTADAEGFKTAFERFGVPLSHEWQLDGDSDATLAGLVNAIKQTSDAGTLYLALDPTLAARLVEMLREAEVPNDVIGTKDLATHQFALAFDPAVRERFMNGTLVLTPVLLDTSGSDAQLVRARHVTAFGGEPDWSALVAAQAVKAIGDAARRLDGINTAQPVATYRAPLGDALGLGQANAAESKLGGLSFDADGVAGLPIGVGVYDGENLVSAPTQLQTIGLSEVDNYIALVREGRALYVNDRFMYKTNVVYTGLVVKEIRDFDPLAATFDMDLVLWFRYRGDLPAEEVLFENAITPISLDTPDKTERSGDLTYVSYDITGTFSANFMTVDRAYGTELYGLSFRHRSLDQNNFRYVVDMVGMGLVGDATLTAKMNRTRALSPALNQVVSRAWISQDIVRTDGLGSLTFVGSGKPQPDFSEITFGAIAAGATPSISDFIDDEYLIHALLFSVTGLIFALVMDRRRQGKRLIWSAQTWILYAVCGPLLALSGGALLLNLAFGRIEFSYLDILVDIYRSVLWIVPAIIVALAIKRFIWLPLELRSGRKVPGAIQAMVMILIYAFAGVGVLSNVFSMDMTSIIAASGVLSLVIGLALQNNIANIFSGIVLNLERPFKVGDILLLANGTEAEIVDITWRSIQVRDSLGIVHSIPNNLATSQQMTRVTAARGEPYAMRIMVNVSPKHEPAEVERIIKQALDKAEGTLPTPRSVWYSGIGATEFATFGVKFAAPEYGDRDSVRSAVWTAIWRALGENGIEVSRFDASSVGGALARAQQMTPQTAHATV